jgi:hypothetical protein
VLLDEGNHVVSVGVAAEHRFREHERPVDVHVEDSVCARDNLDRPEAIFMLFEKSSHQTGGVLPCSSGDAVLDPDAVPLGHPAILTAEGGAVATYLSAFSLITPVTRRQSRIRRTLMLGKQERLAVRPCRSTAVLSRRLRAAR